MGKANRNRAARAELVNAGILYRNNRNRRGINSQEAKTTEFFKYQERDGKSLTLFSQKTALGDQLCLKIEEGSTNIKIVIIAEKISSTLGCRPTFFSLKDQEDQTQKLIISYYEAGSFIASSYNLNGDLQPKTIISLAESGQVKTIKTSETQFSIITKKTGQNTAIKQYFMAKGELREGLSLALTKKPPASLASVAMSTELSSARILETVILYKGYYSLATLEEKFYFSKIISTTEETPKVISFSNIPPKDISGVSLIKNPDPKATAKYIAIFKDSDTLYIATFKKDRSLLSDAQLVKLSSAQPTATLEISSFSYQYSTTAQKFRLLVTARSSNNPSITANDAEDNFVQEVTFKMDRLGNAVDLSSVTNKLYKVLTPEVSTTTSRSPTSELETTFVSLSLSTSALGLESTSITSLLTSLASLTSTFLFSSTILTTETTQAPSTSTTIASSTHSTPRLTSASSTPKATSSSKISTALSSSPSYTALPTTATYYSPTTNSSSASVGLSTAPNTPAGQIQNSNTLLVAGSVFGGILLLIGAACAFGYWCCGKRKSTKITIYQSTPSIPSLSDENTEREALPLTHLGDNPFVTPQLQNYSSVRNNDRSNV